MFRFSLRYKIKYQFSQCHEFQCLSNWLKNICCTKIKWYICHYTYTSLYYNTSFKQVMTFIYNMHDFSSMKIAFVTCMLFPWVLKIKHLYCFSSVIFLLQRVKIKQFGYISIQLISSPNRKIKPIWIDGDIKQQVLSLQSPQRQLFYCLLLNVMMQLSKEFLHKHLCIRPQLT